MTGPEHFRRGEELVAEALKLVGAEYPVTLCDLGIFVEQAAGPVPVQDPDIPIHSGRMLMPRVSAASPAASHGFRSLLTGSGTRLT